MSKFAMIPEYLIDRMSELSKREYVILSILYLHRNKRTGQCNPSKKLIAARSKIGLNHVYATLKSLAEKGWIQEEMDGRFHLLNPNEGQVTQKTGDNSHLITLDQSDISRAEELVGNGKVQNRDLSSPKSGPENSQIGTQNSDAYIEHFLTEKEQTNEQSDTGIFLDGNLNSELAPDGWQSDSSSTCDLSDLSIKKNCDPQSDFPLNQLLRAFPKLILTPAQAGMIQATVKLEDSEAWAATIQTYVGNHDPSKRAYMPERVGTLLNVFKDNRKRQRYGTNNRVVYKSEREKSAERGQNARDLVARLRAEGLADRAEAERKRLAG